MYFDLNKEIETVDYDIKYLPNSTIKYRFITPYVALNEENYKKYIKGEMLLDKLMGREYIRSFKRLKLLA